MNSVMQYMITQDDIIGFMAQYEPSAQCMQYAIENNAIMMIRYFHSLGIKCVGGITIAQTIENPILRHETIRVLKTLGYHEYPASSKIITNKLISAINNGDNVEVLTKLVDAGYIVDDSVYDLAMRICEQEELKYIHSIYKIKHIIEELEESAEDESDYSYDI
jgi:hypothetical protein